MKQIYEDLSDDTDFDIIDLADVPDRDTVKRRKKKSQRDVNKTNKSEEVKKKEHSSTEDPSEDSRKERSKKARKRTSGNSGNGSSKASGKKRSTPSASIITTPVKKTVQTGAKITGKLLQTGARGVTLLMIAVIAFNIFKNFWSLLLARNLPVKRAEVERVLPEQTRSQIQRTSMDRRQIMQRNWQMPRTTMQKQQKKRIRKPKTIFRHLMKFTKSHLLAAIHLPHHLHLVEVVEQVTAVFRVQLVMWTTETSQKVKPRLIRLAIPQRNLLTFSKNSGNRSGKHGKKRVRIPLKRQKTLCRELQNSLRV